MGSALAFTGPYALTFVDEPAPPLVPGSVRLRTLFSGISAGTELTAYRGTNPYLHKGWDRGRRLFVADTPPQHAYPLIGWGYEEVGEIVEVGPQTADLAVGQRVYGVWGHRTHHVAEAEYARPRLLPPHVEPILGIFSNIGAIALNGILDAQINLGEAVAVFGMGVVGQIVAQLARLSGAHVLAVDLLPARLELAQRLAGATIIDARAGDAAEKIKDLTYGRGADICIEASGSHSALHTAVRACAYSSRVVAMGFFQGGATQLYLGEEFHHNRVALVCSQISGVSPALQHRWDRLRLATTFMGLVADGRLQLLPLISHVRPFARAESLFEQLDKAPDEVMQAVLSFEEHRGQ